MAAPAAVEPKVINDYSDRIELIEGYLAQAKEQRKHASTEEQMFRAGLAIAQFNDALAVLRDAQQIRPVRTQFGTPESQQWTATVAPGGLPEFRHESGLRIRASNYVYITDDPIQIAHLRRAVERQSIPGLAEMEPGLMAAYSKDGGFYDWLPATQYHRYVESGSGRGW